MGELPQVENLLWLQCGFELTMFRSEDSCANQLRHPSTKNSVGILRSFYRESLNASRAFSMLRHIMPSSEPRVLYYLHSAKAE